MKKDYKELDEAIKSKIVPFLYNEGRGKHIPLIHIALIRNRDRSKSKQNKFVKELTAEIGEDGVFNFVFEGSEFLEKCIQETGQTDPEKSKNLDFEPGQLPLQHPVRRYLILPYIFGHFGPIFHENMSWRA